MENSFELLNSISKLDNKALRLVCLDIILKNIHCDTFDEILQKTNKLLEFIRQNKISE